MARADLLLDLVRAGARGDQNLFRKTLEAMVSEERDKQHHILADRLAAHLQINGEPTGPAPAPNRRNGPSTDLFYERGPERRLEDLLLPEVVQNAIQELVEEYRRADSTSRAQSRAETSSVACRSSWKRQDLAGRGPRGRTRCSASHGALRICNRQLPRRNGSSAVTSV